MRIVQVLFDRQLSVNGALLCALRAPKRTADAVVSTTVSQIYTPFSLPLFRVRVRERERERARLTGALAQEDRPPQMMRGARIKEQRQKERSTVPEMPLTGPGKGGRITNISTWAQHYVKNYVVKSTPIDEDPREALLRYADKAEQHPYWVAPAYQRTQPKPVFAPPDEAAPAAKRPRPSA